MIDGPLLWYLNRATGLVLLVLLTASVVLGVIATRGRPGRGIPRFVSQSLHRNMALIAVVALVAHVVTAVVDSYVDIRWWQALVPAGATYKPLWLGLGTLALDLLAVIVVTSLLRNRLGHRAWQAIHLLSWAAWAAAVIHAVGIGTDLATLGGLGALPTAACVVAVLMALAARSPRRTA
jgi:sulfoxide reductase heme-binding subunit YedZ